MEEKKNHLILLLAGFFLAFTNYAGSQPFIGVNYGEVADNLPPPQSTVGLLQSMNIAKLRLYGTDPAMLSALAGTNVAIVVGASSGDIPTLASSAASAASWAASNLLPYLPASPIATVSVGNEVLTSGDAALNSQLLPAMQNLQTALSSSYPSIKISTVHSMAVLSQSDPPSSGAFHADISPTLVGILGFLRDTGSPFMINPYPFFAYRSDPRPETLAFCLFQPNPGRVDAGSGIVYMNMFDAQVDAIRSALNAAGFPNIEIVVAETGWPYRGDPDEVGTTIENAQAFNGGLVAHLRSMTGTPLMPGKSVDTYIFALYDEDLKPGPLSERSFGLFRNDLTMTYDAGLAKSSASQVNPTPAPAITSPTISPPTTGAGGSSGCMPVGASAQVQGNFNYTCRQKGVDCRLIQQVGDCIVPSSVGYAMNVFYQVVGRKPWGCDFHGGAAVLTTTIDSRSSRHHHLNNRIPLDPRIRFTDTDGHPLCRVVNLSLGYLAYLAVPLLLLLY